jgi:hypothetical protein
MSFRSRSLVLSVITLASLACGDSARSDDAQVAMTPAASGDAVRPTAVTDSLPSLSGSPFAAAVCASAGTMDGAPISVRGVDSAWAVLALERLDQLAPRDSARLAARLARLGGSLATDTTVADFRGLPIAVRSAWRVVPMDGDTVLAAILVRRIPIESDPMEEIFTVLASPEARPGLRDGLRAEWVQRDVGREDAVVFREVVALWRVPGDTVAVLFAHDDDRGVVGQLLTRTAKVWATRWDGVFPHCDATLPR